MIRETRYARDVPDRLPEAVVRARDRGAVLVGYMLEMANWLRRAIAAAQSRPDDLTALKLALDVVITSEFYVPEFLKSLSIDEDESQVRRAWSAWLHKRVNDRQDKSQESIRMVAAAAGALERAEAETIGRAFENL